jgi:hypothetical protein
MVENETVMDGNVSLYRKLKGGFANFFKKDFSIARIFNEDSLAAGR